jgi:hypothetical protein
MSVNNRAIVSAIVSAIISAIISGEEVIDFLPE